MAGARRTLGWVTVSIVLSALVWFMYTVFDRMATEGADSAADRYLLPILSLTIVILALALVGLLIRNLVKLVIDRKRGVLGSRLRTKLVFFLLGFVLFPALMMVYGSGAIIKRTVEAIVRTPVEEITRNASEIVDEWNENLLQQSVRQAGRLAGALGQGVFTELPPQGRTGYLEAWLQDAGMDFALVEETGRREVLGLGDAVELDSPARADLKQSAKALAERGLEEGSTVSEIGFLGGDLLVQASASFRIAEPGGERTGVVTVGLIHSGAATDKMQTIKEHAGTYLLFRLERRELIRLYLMLIGLTLLVTLFLATWIGFYLSKRITGPINEVAAAAREISAGNLGIRVEESTGDEVGVLVDAFNDMAAQLQESREVISRSTADLRTTNRALDERRRYIETLVANLSTAVISLDRKARVTTVNPAVETILGYPLKAGQNIRSSLAGAEFRPLLDMLAQVMDAGGTAGVVARDLEFVRTAGAMTIAIRITALKGWQGEYLGVLIMMEDLTDLQRAQRAAAWREVARRIAHEIKNPLTPIMLSAQRLKKKFLAGSPDLGKILPEATDSIEREVAGLKHLVNEFSRFARMPEVVPQPVDVRELVDSVLALYKAVAGVEWVLEAEPDLGTVALDPQQMRRALVNLLDNAVAAVDGRGRITVRIRRADPGVLVLEVEDSGPGIPAEDRAKLFEPYFSTKPSGTGLGLAVVHRVVTEHRGTIKVKDGESGGARFVVEIPVQAEAGGRG
ncbi:MAG: HAMP domain-containing protein [Acidobacteria bacterium]|uniref:histidine kinase n=1 Tax=Candidatus Polarisedimenticola svalbardensis TaxID=2886004 RepID=A0A8J7C270_9BACT|nr:HAMP domain-containing protein [Candidatus Polarisedimenticola svalbardensis]